MPPIDLPDDLAALPHWILRHATAVGNGGELIDGIGRALNAAGLPVWRISIGTPAIDPTQRGLTVTWRRDAGIIVTPTIHGAEGEADFLRPPSTRRAGSRRSATSRDATS